jgi:S1/P1 Nuclease.
MPIAMRRVAYAVCALLMLVSAPVLAWGPEGHAVVALIARDHLTPSVRQRVEHLLAGDPSNLTAHDIADEADWADRYREQSKAHAQATGKWHYVDLELHRPNLAWACYHFPRLHGRPASAGPARDCVVDKIEQFERELADPRTSASERLLALKFLLHFVGDLHQPLHAADNHDRGGNDEQVELPGHPVKSLHAYWDSVFVAELDPDAAQLARRLNAQISAADVAHWSQGTPTDWAWASYHLAVRVAYGELPPPGPDGVHQLGPAYDAAARKVVAEQLEKAGVRLAWLLNRALGAR